MATFSQFPNEMITGIWEYVLEPRDVESFALVSKHIYALGAPFVDEHNKLKREYSFFSTGLGGCGSVPALFLKKILLWPRVALYVTDLVICDYRTCWDLLDGVVDDDDLLSYHAPYPDDDMKLFIAAIRRARSVPRKEVGNWIRTLKEGNENPILALLLLLLPNLCTMTLLIESGFSYQLPETFRRISETENSPFLTRLTTVNLDVFFQTDDNTMDWEWLSMSANLPSVQSIHVDRIGPIQIDDLLKYRQCFAPGSSTVKELAFVGSSICPKSMFQLFESIKGLKKFSYSKPDERTEPFEPFWMRTALVAYAKCSLESLKITAERTEDAKTLGSFRDCTNLRELETNVHLLMEKGPHSLVDLLPASIEKIHLHTGGHWCCHGVLPIIETFEKAKLQLLPNMRVLKFSFEPGTRWSQEDMDLITGSKKKCRDLGIELSVIAG